MASAMMGTAQPGDSERLAVILVMRFGFEIQTAFLLAGPSDDLAEAKSASNCSMRLGLGSSSIGTCRLRQSLCL